MIDNQLYAMICGPSSLLATVLNVIFILCLRHPASGISLRQPLVFLLTAMLCNSTVQQGTLMVTVLLTFMNAPNWIQVGTKALVYLTYSSCFSSNAWMSQFYYIKIVPHRWAVLIWINKHVEAVVCAGFLVDQIVLLTAISIGTVPYLLPSSPFNSTASLLNGTATDPQRSLSLKLAEFCNLIYILYLTVPVLTLTFSWGKTFVYLRGHIKKMAQSTGPASGASPQQQNQMRVTVMGIVQTALFLPSCLWTIFTVFTYSTELLISIDGNRHLTLTVTSISALANIVCLGFSQSVFRSTVGTKVKGHKKACGLVSQKGNTNFKCF